MDKYLKPLPDEKKNPSPAKVVTYTGAPSDHEEEENSVDFIKYFFKKMKKKASASDTYKSKVNSLNSILKKEAKYGVPQK